MKKKDSKNKSLSELIKSNNFLNKYCIELSDRNNKLFLDLQKNNIHITSLENKIEEIDKSLHFFMSHFPFNPEDFRNNFQEKNNNRINEKQKISLHDDMTERCENCKSIKNKHDETCKECGFKKNKKA